MVQNLLGMLERLEMVEAVVISIRYVKLDLTISREVVAEIVNDDYLNRSDNDLQVWLRILQDLDLDLSHGRANL